MGSEAPVLATAIPVLVVEDDFLVRMTLVEAMTDSGFDVIETDSASEALRLLNEQPRIALLLTDLRLSGSMNGQMLAQAARQERAGLPVLFMTGRPDLVTIDPAAREALIGKPYTPDEICSAAHTLLARSQP